MIEVPRGRKVAEFLKATFSPHKRGPADEAAIFGGSGETSKTGITKPSRLGQ